MFLRFSRGGELGLKKVSTYLPSLIISVLLVFSFLGTAAIILFDIDITAKKCKALAEKNHIESKIFTELDKYFSDKYNITGIPAELYMNTIGNSYIKSFEEAYIDAAFEALSSDGKLRIERPVNQQLEDNLDKFFSDYAEENGYDKDDNYESKLRSAKENAYNVIGSYCDVYKFSAMSNHGVLPQFAKIYSHRGLITAAIIAADIIMIGILLVINRKKKIITLYWTGISSIISGILGAVPSIYLLVTKYYDSFSIKQAPVFIAFTSAMYKVTEAFMAVMIALVVIGISMVVIYGVTNEKKKLLKNKPKRT